MDTNRARRVVGHCLEILREKSRELAECLETLDRNGRLVGDSDPCEGERTAVIALTVLRDAAQTAATTADIALAAGQQLLMDCEART